MRCVCFNFCTDDDVPLPLEPLIIMDVDEPAVQAEDTSIADGKRPSKRLLKISHARAGGTGGLFQIVPFSVSWLTPVTSWYNSCNAARRCLCSQGCVR